MCLLCNSRSRQEEAYVGSRRNACIPVHFKGYLLYLPMLTPMGALLLHSFSEKAQSRDCAAHFREPRFVQMESAHAWFFRFVTTGEMFSCTQSRDWACSWKWIWWLEILENVSGNSRDSLTYLLGILCKYSNKYMDPSKGYILETVYRTKCTTLYLICFTSSWNWNNRFLFCRLYPTRTESIYSKIRYGRNPTKDAPKPNTWA